MNKRKKPIKRQHQGIFVTQTVLGNPNGSFMNNEPRNINGRVYTTDKCIKYNVRDYIHKRYEEIEADDDNNIQAVENFVFFYPRRIEEAEQHESKYLKKGHVFEKFFKNPYEDEQAFQEMLNHCPDVRMFGGTFSFEEAEVKEYGGALYGPVQLSYGIDLMGADIIHLKLGTPFSTEKGKQTTTAEEYGVDHAVISYDITINPRNYPGLLKQKDIQLLKEGLIQGTNLRRSTSKKTESKALILAKFTEESLINLGELKHLIEVESNKITSPEEQPKELKLNLARVKKRLNEFKDKIEKIEIYTDENTEITQFYTGEEEGIEVERASFNALFS